MRLWKTALIVLPLLAVVGCQRRNDLATRPLIVAAAADLKFALDETIHQFTQDHFEVEIKPVYGSSGNFYTQIHNGAPFDMFLSADMDYPNRLQHDGLAIGGTEFEYAVGRLVVWVRKDSSIDVEKLGMAALTDSKLMHVAIANPEHAPYGRNAVAAMQTYNVYENVRPRLVLGENVSQALQFVSSGAAEIGIVAMSLATAPTVQPTGRYWEIPLSAYPRMDQGGVILRSATNKKAADQLRSFILSNKGRTIFKRFGFYMPDESK